MNQNENCNPLKGKGEGAGARARTEPRELNATEVNELLEAARRWVGAGDQSGWLADMFNLAHTAQVRGAELLGVSTHLEMFESRFGVGRPPQGWALADRVTALAMMFAGTREALEAARSELDATARLRDSVARNFDSLHAAAIEALTVVHFARGCDNARERAWQDLDDAFAKQMRRREAGEDVDRSPLTPAGEARRARMREAGGQPLPQAANAPQAGAEGAQEASGRDYGDAFGYVAPPPAPPRNLRFVWEPSPAAERAANATGAEPIALGEMTRDRAERIAGDWMRRQSEVCHAEARDGAGQLIELLKMSPDCPHVLRDGAVAYSPAPGEEPDSEPSADRDWIAADWHRFGDSIIREARKRNLPHFNAQIALGAILAELDKQSEALNQCEEVQRRAHRVVSQYAGGGRGNLANRVQELAEYLSTTADERGAILRDIESFVDHPAWIAHQPDELRASDRWQDLPRKVRAVVGSVDGERFTAEEGRAEAREALTETEEARRVAQEYADERLRALERIRAAVAGAYTNEPPMPHDLTYGECVAVMVETLVNVYMRHTTGEQRAEDRNECEHKRALDTIRLFIETFGEVDKTKIPPLTPYPTAVSMMVEHALRAEAAKREQGSDERPYHAAAICRATGTQTFGAAMAEVQRLQKLEGDARNQLCIILNRKTDATNARSVLNMIAELGELLQGTEGRAQAKFRDELARMVDIVWRESFHTKTEEGAEGFARFIAETKKASEERLQLLRATEARAAEHFARANRAEAREQQAHAVLNSKGIPNVGGQQTVAERLNDLFNAGVETANRLIRESIRIINDAGGVPPIQPLPRRVEQLCELLKRAEGERNEARGEVDNLRAVIERCHSALTDDGVEFVTLALPERLRTVLRSLRSFRSSEQEARDIIGDVEAALVGFNSQLPAEYCNAEMLSAANLPKRVRALLAELDQSARSADEAARYREEEIARHVRAIANADAVVRSMQMPPLDRARMDTAGSLAERITILNEVRVAHIRIISRESSQASETLRRIPNVAQNLPLVRLASVAVERIGQLSEALRRARRERSPLTREVCVKAAELLMRRYKVVGAENDLPTEPQHLGRWLFSFLGEALREAGAGEPQEGARPRNLSLDDCRAIARDIKRRFVVLTSASVMDAANGVGDEELAAELFAMLNPQRAQAAPAEDATADEPDTCGTCGMDIPCPSGHNGENDEEGGEDAERR